MDINQARATFCYPTFIQHVCKQYDYDYINQARVTIGKKITCCDNKINLMVITIVRMMTVVRMMMMTNQTRGDGEKRSNRDETLHW